MISCGVCGNSEGLKPYTVREMMLGTRDEFEYLECAGCGCLQIKEMPPDISKYYPKDYYSYSNEGYKRKKTRTGFIQKQKALYWLYGKNIIGMLASLKRKKEPPCYIPWFKKTGVGFGCKILDVGCGCGSKLLDMRLHGFSDLLGIDPFIAEDICYEGGVSILKRDIFTLEGQFDFILLDHVFEHMPDPASVFKRLNRLLAPKRYLLIRIPLAGTYAWKKYGTNWVQLDAPRHFFLHTVDSVTLLASRSGFRVSDIIFDSTEFQFLASEQYVKDIPLSDKRSYYARQGVSIFSEEDVRDFKIQAAELNRNRDGDQASFYLYKE